VFGKHHPQLGHQAATIGEKSFSSGSQTCLIPQQESPTLSESAKTQHKGFTFAEKWIIWSVFCLLLALSTHWLIFPALQLISWGIVRWRWQMQQRIPPAKRYTAILALAAGGALLAWLIILLRALRE
jgi:hypothetical protein